LFYKLKCSLGFLMVNPKKMVPHIPCPKGLFETHRDIERAIEWSANYEYQKILAFFTLSPEFANSYSFKLPKNGFLKMGLRPKKNLIFCYLSPKQAYFILFWYEFDVLERSLMDQICPLSFSVYIEFYEGLELNFKFYLAVS